MNMEVQLSLKRLTNNGNMEDDAVLHLTLYQPQETAKRSRNHVLKYNT